MRQDPLSIEITDGRLVIAIGVETLAAAARLCEFADEGIDVMDPDGFAADVRAALRDDANEGQVSPVERLLDRASMDVALNGSAHAFIRPEYHGN